MAPSGRTGSVRVTWHVCGLRAGAAPGRRAGRRGRRAARAAAGRPAPRRARRDESALVERRPARSPWCALLAERHRVGGAGVADPLGDRLRPVQVPERGVVGAVEDLGRDRADAADRDVALGVAGDATGDEGVGHDDRAARAGCARSAAPAPSRPAARPRGSGRSAPSGSAQVTARGRGAGRPRRAVDAPPAEPTSATGSADVQPGPLEQAGREPEPDGASRGCRCESDHLGPGVDEPGQRLGEQLDGVGAGQRAVVDVAADEDRVDPLRAHDLDEVVEVAGLGVEQPHPVERASQVPVGGVDQPHAAHATSAGATAPGTSNRRFAALDRPLAVAGPVWLGLAHGRRGRGAGVHAVRSASGTARRCARTSTSSSRCWHHAQLRVDKPMTGLEIELNLVDADFAAARWHNAHGARRHRRPGLPDRARRSTTSSSTSRRGRCPATPRSSSRTTAAGQPQPRPRRQANEVGAHIVAIGILPTLMPEHFHSEWMSANTRYAAAQRGGLRRPRRGHLHRHRGTRRASGWPRTPTRSPPSRPAPRAAAPAGRPAGLRRRTGTPPRPSSGRSSRSAPTRRTSSASSCGPRPGSSCSPRPPTPARSS